MDQPTSRLKRAELTSTVGAAVLGAGVGLLLDRVLRPHARGHTHSRTSHAWLGHVRQTPTRNRARDGSAPLDRVVVLGMLVGIAWAGGLRRAAVTRAGVVSSTLLTLIVIPAIYALWMERAVHPHAPFTVPSRLRL